MTENFTLHVTASFRDATLGFTLVCQPYYVYQQAIRVDVGGVVGSEEKPGETP